MKLAKAVATYRERNRLSQLELARRIGISQAAIGYIEKGEHLPTMQVLCRIARYFEFSPEEVGKLVLAAEGSRSRAPIRGS